MRRIWLQVVHTSLAKGYALVTAVLVLAVTARYLGPAGRGVVGAANAWAAMVATFGGLSLGQVAIFHAAGRDPAEWLPSTLHTVGRYLLATTLVVWIAGAIAYRVTDGHLFNHLSPSVLALAAVSVPLLMWTDYATSLLLALDSLKIANIAQAVASTSNALIVVALLTVTSLGVRAPLISVAIGGALSAFVTLRAIRRKMPVDRTLRRFTGRMLVDGAKLHANAIGTFFFTQANLLIVNHYCSASDTGFFGLATQLITVAQIVPNAIGLVAYTVVGRDGPDQAWKQQRRLLAQAAAVSAALIVIGYVAAPLGVRLVAGKAFLPAVPLFRVMLLALVGMTFSSIMASQWIGRGLFGMAAGISLATGGANVVATFVVVPQSGAMGAAWVMVGVYAISILGNGLMALWVERRVQRVLVPVPLTADASL
ncbi:MAG TPA: oligosaccharide flippase family protein [Gemmatimonadaceae bacterium]|nr:oligosaccharide flippase family protein [Gemmatimonadaceae bacterium]